MEKSKIIDTLETYHVAKGNFIEIDPSIAHEIIEGIVGTLPQQKGHHRTQ